MIHNNSNTSPLFIYLLICRNFTRNRSQVRKRPHTIPALICSHQLGPQLAQNGPFCANFKRIYCSFKTHTRLAQTQAQTTCTLVSLKRKRRPPSSHWTTTLFHTLKSIAVVGYSLSYPLSNSAIFFVPYTYSIWLAWIFYSLWSKLLGKFGWLDFLILNWANFVGMISWFLIIVLTRGIWFVLTREIWLAICCKFSWLEFFTGDEANYWANLVGLILSFSTGQILLAWFLDCWLFF